MVLCGDVQGGCEFTLSPWGTSRLHAVVVYQSHHKRQPCSFLLTQTAWEEINIFDHLHHPQEPHQQNSLSNHKVNNCMASTPKVCLRVHLILIFFLIFVFWWEWFNDAKHYLSVSFLKHSYLWGPALCVALEYVYLEFVLPEVGIHPVSDISIKIACNSFHPEFKVPLSNHPHAKASVLETVILL